MTTEAKKESKVDPKYRKIYRSMIEKGNKLDEIYKNPDSFAKIFQSDTTLEREKLQRYCETLIFREPILCGKKAEEILWRRVFYEIIHIVKSNKKNLKCNSQIETMYRLHLSSAYGFYNHLILRFQSEFNSIIQLNGLLDFPFLSYEKQPLTINIPENSNSKLLKEVLIRILHKFLICLGDLSRYQIEYDPLGSSKLAFKYYQMSLILIPTNGMPLNQLGTLYGSENYGCDAAYYYLYCLSCTDPFVSARENLRLLFIKNRKRYEEITNKKFIEREKAANYELTELRTKEIKKFLVLFLRIIDSILVSSSTILSSQSNNKSVLISNHQLQEMCQLCLQEFNACMFYTDKSIDSPHCDKLSYLSDELVFKLTMTILMTIEHLKSRRSNLTDVKTNIYFTTVAFSLVFFSHIVNHTIIRLQDSLLNLNKKNSPIMTENQVENAKNISDAKDQQVDKNNDSSTNSSSSSEDNKQSDSKSLKKRRGVRLLYGLRRRKHNSDSDTNDSEDEIDDRDRNFSSENSENDGKLKSQRKSRKKNIAKFLERENLSETELNVLSSDEYSNDNKNDRKAKLTSDSDSGSQSSKSPEVLVTKQNQQKESKIRSTEHLEKKTQSEELDADEALDPNEISMNAIKLSNQASLNFKEFSMQLYSCLSSIQDSSSKATTSQTENIHDVEMNSDLHTNEFVDNEIYKFVLNGNKNVEIPPGFEIFSKEAKEIEELGKKIATFQIETDTEMSIFNSSNTSTNSDIDNAEDNKDKNDVQESDSQKINPENEQLKNIKLQDLRQTKILVNLLQREALLPTIKVFCDWLLCNMNVIQSISQVSTTVWSKLAVLLNCIPLEKHILSEGICENDYVKSLILKSFETKSWNRQPLSEDVHMRSFRALRLEHSLLEFDVNKLNQLNVAEENLLRLCQLRRFGYLIASLSQSQLSEGGCGFFEYNVSKAAFNALIISDNKKSDESEIAVDESKSGEKFTQDTNSKEKRKFQLMKNMAQLRLEAEISQLESNYKNDDFGWSPYLVADTAALCENLKIVQDLARTNKFIIIVPLVVIDNLDSIKKDSKQAREAIRWLENQFKQGNRFLRAQTHNEKITTSDNMGLKKKDLELWRFHQLVDCCKYFQEESVSNCHSNSDNKANVITILTFSDLADTKNRYMLDITSDNAIKLENVKEFYERWQGTKL